MEPAPPQKEKKSRSNFYFGIASGLLFLMALVWSIDASFVYILTGAILVFGLLGFQTSERIATPKAAPYHFSDTFQQTKQSTENDYKPRHTGRVAKPLIIAISVVFFLSMAIFIIVIALNDDGDYDSEFQYEQAEIFYNQRQYDSAAIFYRRALTGNAENEAALTGYGNTLMMQEQYDSAIIFYDKALTINPSYEKATYQKAAVLSYQKKYQQSIELMKDLLKENPAYPDASQLIGDNYYNQQRYDSALRWYNKAYDGGVRNRYLFHLMGYIHETKGDNANAIKCYQEALQYDSSVVDIYERLGALLTGQSGDFYRRKAAQIEKEN